MRAGKAGTMSRTTAADPITTAVVHNTLLTTAKEMRETIQRTSFSPVNRSSSVDITAALPARFVGITVMNDQSGEALMLP